MVAGVDTSVTVPVPGGATVTVEVDSDAGSAGSRLTLPVDSALSRLRKLEFKTVAAPDDPPPGGFRIAGSQAVVSIALLDTNDNHITGLSSPATVCLPISAALLTEAGDRPLSLLHYDANAGWTQLPGSAVRLVNGTRLLCAQTTRFSPFAIAYQSAPVTPSDDGDERPSPNTPCPANWPSQGYQGALARKDYGRIGFQDFFTDDGG